MKLITIFISFLLSFSNYSLADNPSEVCNEALSRYFNYLRTYENTLGPIGNASKGEIEIIQDIGKIHAIEQATGRKVGVIAEDHYWIWLNDAVKFPSGKEGVYGRLIWRVSLKGTPGVAVMPILPDGKIALNRNYRHATRSWEYELPRGAVEANETVLQAAQREVKEETGMQIDQLHYLGTMQPDTGLTNTNTPIFCAKVIQQQEASPEDSEAIASIDTFTVEELKRGFLQGYLVINTNGTSCKISLRDPFLVYALFQADLRGLIK